MKHHQFQILILICLACKSLAVQVQKRQKSDNVVAEMQVVCQSNAILLKLSTNTPFNGMVYAKDAPSNGNCMTEFNSSTDMTFRLPLKSCGTLSAEVDDGVEFFNTVVVQPHMRLMTNQGKGYHIRCKYQTRERTIANSHFNVSASFLMQNNPTAVPTPLLATASMPSCTMKIFRSGRDDVAETVRIGDKLIMVIEIDQQDMYGMRVTNCLVRDGLNMAEQQLINDSGDLSRCPLDENIMPKFEYTNNSTRAAVSFPAHKFPHTSSVYYQCNVRLCINNGGCDQIDCGQSGNSSNYVGSPRRKRYIGGHEVGPSAPESAALGAKAARDMSFDVYSGLYVSDIDVGESVASDKSIEQVGAPPARAQSRKRMDSSPDRSSSTGDEEFCLSSGQAGLAVLMSVAATVGVMMMLACQVGNCGPEQQVSSRGNLIPNRQYPLAGCQVKRASAELGGL